MVAGALWLPCPSRTLPLLLAVLPCSLPLASSVLSLSPGFRGPWDGGRFLGPRPRLGEGRVSALWSPVLCL